MEVINIQSHSKKIKIHITCVLTERAPTIVAHQKLPTTLSLISSMYCIPLEMLLRMLEPIPLDFSAIIFQVSVIAHSYFLARLWACALRSWWADALPLSVPSDRPSGNGRPSCTTSCACWCTWVATAPLTRARAVILRDVWSGSHWKNERARVLCRWPVF